MSESVLDPTPQDAEGPPPAPSAETGHGRSARLSVRLPDPHKALIDRAAAISGLTTTAFTVSTLVERARAVVLEDRLTELSDADRDAFLGALEDDPAPAEALLRADEATREADPDRLSADEPSVDGVEGPLGGEGGDPTPGDGPDPNEPAGRAFGDNEPAEA